MFRVFVGKRDTSCAWLLFSLFFTLSGVNVYLHAAAFTRVIDQVLQLICFLYFTLGKQKNAYSLHVSQKPDQILAQSSDVSLGATGVNPSSLVNQFRDNKISRPVLSIDTAPTGMMRTRYNSTPYSFPGNSGS